MIHRTFGFWVGLCLVSAWFYDGSARFRTDQGISLDQGCRFRAEGGGRFKVEQGGCRLRVDQDCVLALIGAVALGLRGCCRFRVGGWVPTPLFNNQFYSQKGGGHHM